MDLSFDVMIPAHAETIEQLLTLLMAVTFQKVPGWKLRHLFVCSDNPKIQAALSGLSHLDLICQDPRRGKPDAMNRMFERSRSFYAGCS